jgi:hypothetical protein
MRRFAGGRRLIQSAGFKVNTFAGGRFLRSDGQMGVLYGARCAASGLICSLGGVERGGMRYRSSSLPDGDIPILFGDEGGAVDSHQAVREQDLLDAFGRRSSAIVP